MSSYMRADRPFWFDGAARELGLATLQSRAATIGFDVALSGNLSLALPMIGTCSTAFALSSAMTMIEVLSGTIAVAGSLSASGTLVNPISGTIGITTSLSASISSSLQLAGTIPCTFSLVANNTPASAPDERRANTARGFRVAS